MKSFKTSKLIFIFQSAVYKYVVLFPLGLLGSGALMAQVTGTVFRDYNGDGLKGSAEPLVAGITVNVYNTAGTLCGTATTTSATAPNYSVSGCSGNVRVEFVIPNTGSCLLDPDIDFTSTGGSSYGSSVQFATSTSSNVNFAINAPEDYFTAGANPQIYTPVYVNGNPSNGSVAAADALVGVSYDASGVSTQYASVSEMGATWGVAYSRQAGKLFAGAFLKRHVGLGPLGSGGIYLIDPVTNVVTNWLNLSDVGIATQGAGAYAGSGPSAANVPFTTAIGTNVQRNLGNGLDQPSYDAPAYAQVGKLSLGDIDISDDGRYLFVMNLYDKTVYRIDLVDPANPQAPNAGNAATRIKSWAVPSPGCTNGTHRPFGLEFARGNLFVGLVCSAESGGTVANLEADVYQVTDFDAGTYSTLFTIPLSYNKGSPFTWMGTQAYDGWFPWTDDASTIRGSGSNIYPQPVLCDIVFDADGSLIMSFFDRNGHQSGWYNYQPDNTNLLLTVIGGDLLRAYFNPATCSYELESNGKEGPSSPKAATGGAGNGQGPGGGEFYFKDCFQCNTPIGGGNPHEENVQGGIAMALGSGEVAVAVVDPVTYDSGGFTWFDNTTGQDVKDFELYYTGNSGGMPATGTFSKANGLGDVEVSAQLAPLEIGNRVWNDSDSDGIQDAGESGIANVTMELYADFDNDGNPDGAALASTNTASDGTWYFNASNVTDGDPGTSGNQAGPQPEKRYLIRVGNTDWSGGVGVAQLSNLFLTTSNVGGSGQPDVRDNDATLSSSIPTISYLTGKSGQNDHTLDMGFKVASCALTSAGETLETCNNNGTPSNAADDYITFSLNPTGTTLGATYSVTADNGGTVTLAGGGAATAVAYGSATAFRLQTGSANNTLYTITVTDASGAPCTATTTVQQMSCSSTCALTSAGETLETCNNNGTPSNAADDYITFSLNPTGLNLGATYSVTANNGGTVTLAGGGAATAVAYGSATAFRLQTGSANNTLYTITITDVGGAPCIATTTVQQMSCSSTCALTSAGETLETCNNNGTSSDPADDYITFSLNPTGLNLGATYSVTANNGGTVTLAGGGAATAVAYGSATAFRLQTGSANNTLYTITITDVGGAPCIATTTVQQMSCSSTCSLVSQGKTFETCNDNGSPSNPADDYITFSLNPTGLNLGATYSVTANNGGTVTLAGGGAATAVPYGSATAFRLQTGSANNTLYTITVTDASGAPCTATSIAQQMSCSSTCSLSNLTEGNRSPCSNNGTVGPGNDGDDWVTADITLEFSNRPATGNLVLTGDVLPGGGALSVPVGSLGAGPTYTFVGVRLVADGTPITVTATFDAAPSCTVTNSTLPSAPRCSNCPDIPCGDTDFIRN